MLSFSTECWVVWLTGWWRQDASSSFDQSRTVPYVRFTDFDGRVTADKERQGLPTSAASYTLQLNGKSRAIDS